MEQESLENIFDNTPKNLILELGTALYISEGEIGARSPDDSELIKRAKNWLKQNRDKISKIIHNDPKLRDLAYNQRDKQVLVSALTDALIVSFTSIPAATIATLIVHYALDHYLKPDDLDD